MENKNLLLELKQAKQRALEAEKKVTALKMALSDAESLNNEILQSTIWKVSAPIRYSVNWIKRVLFTRQHSKRNENYQTDNEVSALSASTLKTPYIENICSGLPFSAQTPTIVVSIFNAPDAARECLESILRNTIDSAKVIIIDDASTDPKIGSLLKHYSTKTNWITIRNSDNFGYTRTVNLGILEAGDCDVIILNSDTIVSPNWVQRLRIAAYLDKKTASVTPISNNAGAFSIPTPHSCLQGKEHDQIARRISQNPVLSLEKVPTGNGFCMYMRRDAIEDVGAFDDVLFPRGYGEENDWSMRAIEKGWSNFVDFSIFVGHRKSSSFGDERHELLEQGRTAIDSKYPSYTYDVRRTFGGKAITSLRDEATKIAASKVMPKPRFLFTISTKTGGTPLTNLDLMAGLSDWIDCYVLRSDSTEIELSKLSGGTLDPIETIPLKDCVEAQDHYSKDYDGEFLRILHTYNFELVHVRHIGWHSLSATRLAKTFGIPVVFSFHDFYTVCPTVKLLDENWRHCGGSCSTGNGLCPIELWKPDDFPNLKNGTIHYWRAEMSQMLSWSDSFVTTSETAKEILIRNFPDLKGRDFHVIPHGRDLTLRDVKSNFKRDQKLRILVLGNINEAKGQNIYRDLAKTYPEWEVEFHFLGHWRGVEIPNPRYIFHGPYLRDELPVIISKLNLHCAAILSVWPETYCHTLSECWAAGLPVFGFNLGAVGERIKKHGGGWAIDEISARSVKNTIDESLTDEDTWSDISSAISRWKLDAEANRTTNRMVFDYMAIYSNLSSSFEFANSTDFLENSD